MNATFPNKTFDHENEKASNSYLMSLVAIVAGLPLPIVNVIATFFYFIANRKSTYFVRWHCIQALLSQLGLLPFNSVLFWWTIGIIFGDHAISNEYFAYLSTLLIFNLAEFASTIYCAVQTRKGKHVEIWFFGGITNLMCRK